MTAFDPVACEAAAFRLKSEKKYVEAAELFGKIIREHPDWESGGGALSSYEMALSYDPTNSIFLGNYNALREMLGRS